MRLGLLLFFLASSLELKVEEKEQAQGSSTRFHIRARLRRHRFGHRGHTHYFIPQHSPPCRHLAPEKRAACELEYDKEEVKKWSAGPRKGGSTTVSLLQDGF